MPNPLLPPVIPNRLGAVLAGRSQAGFLRDIWPHCAAVGGTDLARLEACLGVEFEPAAYLAAQRRLDPVRAWDRAHKRSA